MAFMITKFIQRTWFVYVQILLKLPVVFLLKFGHRNRNKLNQNRARFRFGVRFRFGFSAYVKAPIGIRHFIFSGRFRCICEMALTPMSAFTYAPKPKPNQNRTENMHDFDFICFGGRISANTTVNFNKICTYTTTCVVYNLVIMKAIDGLSCQTIVRLFYKHNTIAYRLLWDNTQGHELKAVTWNNLYCKGISAI